MGVLYYIKDDPQFSYPRELDIDLLWKLQQNQKGELFLAQGNEKIVYDTIKGSTDLVFLNVGPGVNMSYSTDITNKILHPVKAAMSTLAKLDLLYELAKLGDPEIERIVKEADAKIPTMKNPAGITSIVEGSLSEIYDYVSPHPSRGFTLFSSEKHVPPRQRTVLQDAIYQALTNTRVNSIASSDAVKDILQQIKQPAKIPVAPKNF